MTPFGWIGDRLLCAGEDGRIYLRAYVTTFTRLVYAHLPRVTYDGEIEGRGCERWEDPRVKMRDAFPLVAFGAVLLWSVVAALVWSGLALVGAP